LGRDKVHAIIENVEKNPLYLPTMGPAKKTAKLKQLREAL